MSEERPSLLAKRQDQLVAMLAAIDEPAYRAKQLLEWLYTKRTNNPDEMTNLSQDLRAKLSAAYSFHSAKVARVQEDGEFTTKFALRYPDGNVVESVLMFERQRDGSERRTLCVSTQAGCAMGCRFCASGQLGLKRHLSGAEILEQVFLAAKHLGPERWLSNVVYMGMGEPLHNWEGFTESLLFLTDPKYIGMSPRRVTVSTVGLANRIRDLAALDIPVNLAVSLHAPDDAVRDELIPTNRAYGGIEGIIDAAADYFAATKRQVTFEYTLVANINDGFIHADKLAALLSKRLPGSNINLIPMNPVHGSGLQPPGEREVEAFAGVLERAGFSVHTRKKKGRSISAACGQLRLEVIQDS